MHLVYNAWFRGSSTPTNYISIGSAVFAQGSFVTNKYRHTNLHAACYIEVSTARI